MTKRFYKLMCFATAAMMSIIGCNKTTSGDNDQYQENEFKDTLYGCESIYYDEADVDQPNIPDIDEDHYYSDTVYGDPGVDFDDSVDNDANVDEDVDDHSVITPDVDEPDVQGDEYACPYATFHVDGKAANTNGDPIRGVKVTAQYHFSSYPKTTATKSDGSFLIESEEWTSFSDTEYVLLNFEDIDGELNGGLYVTQELNIQLDHLAGSGGWDWGTYEKKNLFVTLYRVGETDDDTLLSDD
ncbi:MAG TPA: radical SAM-associated putative lipoprotein [bacterium]|nr:radical SAM-associated putative lipoprotein [bacterium]